MYEINKERINSQARYLLTCLQVISEVGISTKLINQFAVMRALHIGVECMIDIGNCLIDGFIMRDPGGYLDIVDILEDEQVITTESAGKLKELVKFREQLVRNYDQVNETDLIYFIQTAEIFHDFKHSVELFLANEQAKGNIY